MLQSPGGLNVVADSLLFICLSHFWHAHHPSLPILPLPRLPRLSSPSSPFMSPHFALVNHTRLSSLSSRLPPASSQPRLCSARHRGNEQRGGTSCLYKPRCTVTPPVSLLIHICVCLPVHLHDCLFALIFSCLSLLYTCQ